MKYIKRIGEQKGYLFLGLIAFFAFHLGAFWLIKIPSHHAKKKSALYVTSLFSLLDKEEAFIQDNRVIEPSLRTKERVGSPVKNQFSTAYSVADERVHFWWHTLPRLKPLAAAEHEENAKVFWRGEVAAYALDTPIQAKHRGTSAGTLRYRVQVDLAHGRLLYAEPLEESAEEEVVKCVRMWLGQQRFSCCRGKGIISGEVELCFGGEYG